MKRTRMLAAAALAVGAVAVAQAASASDSGPVATAATTKLKLSANAQGKLKFNRTRLTARAGKVTISMKNPSSSGLQHAIAVEGKGVDKDGQTADPGGRSKVTVRLKKGTYEFYCPVDGHKAAGMKGTLVVS